MALSIEELDKKLVEAKQRVAEIEELISLYMKYAHEANGKAPHSRRASAKKRDSRGAIPRSAYSASSPKPPNSNGLKAALLDLNFQAPFTVDEAVKVLRGKNLNFGRRQVRDSIYVMVKNREGFRRVKQGRGGKQSQYEKTST